MSENVVAVRSIEIVTAEINTIRDNARKVFLDAVVQIGTRLEEAKQLVPQGEWTAYLMDKLGYKPSTAQNYMRIAREFGGGQVSLSGKTAADAFAELSYSQILPLLGMPEEEREELAEEHDLPHMSSREIAALVKERDEAKAAADQLGEKDKTLRAKLRPAEVRELSEQELDELREKIRAENADAVCAAEARALAAEENLGRAKNPAAHKVNFLFHEMIGLYERIGDALAELQKSDEAACEKFAAAVADWMRKKGDELA